MASAWPSTGARMSRHCAAALGLPGRSEVQLRDELTGAVFTWGERNFVRLSPGTPAHILHVQNGG